MNGAKVNLGYVQSSPRVADDGSVTIVYHNGDRCGAASRYSTRLIFHRNRMRTGENCRVQEPHSGHMFDLSSLKGRDFPVQSGKYTYHLSVCGGLQRGVCTHKDTGDDRVASCQADGDAHKI
ncbi:hypothetical protein CRUP_023341, partial [Coryphaenoides rupestris]